MNDNRFDAKLVAAAKRRSDDTNTFISTTMQKIKTTHVINSLDKKTRRASTWQRLMRLPAPQRLAFGAIAAIALSVASFTGYAYAIGSDPLSLITRIVEGDKVKIEYQNRQFEHGTSRSYSDAAVTAYAEVNTVSGLAFRAANDLQRPQNGVEYVGLPPSMNPVTAYQRPTFATVQDVTDKEVTVHKQYTWGDKVEPSHDIDETVKLPLDSVRYYAQGEPATATKGTLIMLFTDTSIRHDITSNKSTKATTYFGFALSHDLAAYKEASMTTIPSADAKQNVIYEPSWGGLSDVCLNNGADSCDLNHFSQQDNDGLFGGSNRFSPEAYAAVDAGNDSNMISRNLMGEIVGIDDQSITLKTSSGAKWKLAYSKTNRTAFDQSHTRPLRVGDRLTGQVSQSIDDLNSRTVDTHGVLILERYQ